LRDITKRLILALDFSTWQEAAEVAQNLPEVEYFKVGLELYLASRGEAVQRLKAMGKEVFLDLKFHDIPNTVNQASRQAVAQGAAIFNYHATGGLNMMRQGAETARSFAAEQGLRTPLIIAVTVLTSMNHEDLSGIGIQAEVKAAVTRLAKLTKDAGLDGVVASPQEIPLIREACGTDFKIICPGVRPEWATLADQKRTMTPKEAIELGADFLVIGRPITRADNPREAARLVLQEMSEGFATRIAKEKERVE